MKIKLTSNQALNLMKVLNEAEEDKFANLSKFLKIMSDPGKELLGISNLKNKETSTQTDSDSADISNLSINVADSSLLFNPLATDTTYSQEYRSGHPAIDFKTVSGSKVYAPEDGVIEIARDLSPNDCGGCVKIRHDKLKIFTTFCHLRKWTVREGQSVRKGQIIGYTGGAYDDPHRGHSTGPHLHYQIKDLANNPINPNSLKRV